MLSEFDCTVMHCAGKRHTNADALPRGRCRQCGLDGEEDETLFCDACVTPHATSVDRRGDQSSAEF